MGRLNTFIIGALLGAGVALLYSPNSGQRNRELLAEKLNGAVDQAQKFAADPNAAAQGASEFAQAAREKAQSYAAEAAESVKPVFASKNDELREKIEAARQRIADQIAKNAAGIEAEAVVEDVPEKEAAEEVPAEIDADVAETAVEETVEEKADDTFGGLLEEDKQEDKPKED